MCFPPWDQVRTESCLPNFLLFISHLIFFVLFVAIAILIVLKKKLFCKSSGPKILVRFPGHVPRWILNTVYLVVLLISLGESILSDSKLAGPTQPHLYLPVIFALLTGIMTACLYHVIELTQKPRVVFSLFLYWLVVLILEVNRLGAWARSEFTKADVTVIRFDVMVVLLVVYTLYMVLDILVIIKKVRLLFLICDTIKGSESHVGNFQFWFFNMNYLSILKCYILI